MNKQALTSTFRTITEENPYRICFVCLGNICRSPTAEGVLQHLAVERGLGNYFEIDSAGTSAYHIGELPNRFSRQIAASHGVMLGSRAQQFEQDFGMYYDLILTMDQENYDNIIDLDIKSEFSNKVMLFRNFDPKPDDYEVPDPYAGGIQGFENVYQITYRTCQVLLDQLETYIKA
ncbi:MAG TPA: low molecular weight protein-tyrosine-phosphatase [Balneolales bacterium]|nr:low molecular weight protein-tyrosine-phosphatase [Balneolales bacterium]